MMQKADTIMCW